MELKFDFLYISGSLTMKLLHSKVDELAAYRFNANDHCRLAILVDPEISGGGLYLVS